MTISYIYTGEPMNGTSGDDFFIVYKGSTGTDNNTVHGNGGSDLVIGDSSDTWIPNASYLNDSIATAFNLETLTGTWTTAENQLFGDWTIPHTTAIVETTIGQSEYFRVQIGAGQQIRIDIDFASNTTIGSPRDVVVELQDSLGNVIVTADDSLVTDGGRGSFPSSPGSASSYDPYLVYTVANAGIYYINVRPFGGGPGSTFTENNTFVMNLNITGHAVAVSNPVQGNDTINGGDGNDALFGQGGADIINGDGGNDFIDAGSGGDIVHGGEGNDTLYGGDGSEENIHGDNGNDTLFSGGEGHYYGDAGNDLIYAGLTAGVNEVLDGGADVDTLDTTTWNGAYEIDLAAGTSNFGEIFSNFENLVSGNGEDVVTGTGGANDISTRGGVDTVDAGAGNDIVAGGADGDTLDGGIGFDILNYRLSSGAVTVNLIAQTVSGGHATGDIVTSFEGVWGSVLSDTLTADAGDNELRGFEGNDILSGGVGGDILDGGLNDDTMTGGTGNDIYYVDSLGDVVNELPGEGTDTLAAGFSYTLAEGSPLEWLATIDPTASTAINLTGNSAVNSIYGNAGGNTLVGNGGGDSLFGLDGHDTLYGGDGQDAIAGGAGQDVLLGGADGDYLLGGADNDLIQGDGGSDNMFGGTGDDTFFVDVAGDLVTEAAGEGFDRVISIGSYEIGAASQVEVMQFADLAGVSAFYLYGSDIANTLYGNAGSNVLSGGGGDDYVVGLGGNDTLYGGDGNDAIDGGLGHDAMLGGAGADYMVGGEGNDLIHGEGGNDQLFGSAGDDQLVGGLGDDSFYVTDAGDTAAEAIGAGFDRVISTVGYSLAAGAEIEVLQTADNAGIAALALVGNDIANSIYGNAGGNVLAGNGGADYLVGLEGADTLYGGTGADAIDGGAGSDVLYGGPGADYLVGGANADYFAFFDALGGGNVDTIADMAVGSDLIALDDAVFAGLATGTLLASAFVAGTAAADAGDRVIYDSASGQLWFDADGTGAGAAVLFAAVTPGTSLTNVDFLVV